MLFVPNFPFPIFGQLLEVFVDLPRHWIFSLVVNSQSLNQRTCGAPIPDKSSAHKFSVESPVEDASLETDGYKFVMV